MGILELEEFVAVLPRMTCTFYVRRHAQARTSQLMSPGRKKTRVLVSVNNISGI